VEQELPAGDDLIGLLGIAQGKAEIVADIVVQPETPIFIEGSSGPRR